MYAVNDIISCIQAQRINLTNEKISQQQLHTALTVKNLDFKREYRLDEKNIPDFFADGIAIEIKIKGSRRDIYLQCKRYCEFDQVKILILCSSKSMGFPGVINGKPCYFINLSTAYL